MLDTIQQDKGSVCASVRARRMRLARRYKGKVEKLERRVAKQQAKLAKAEASLKSGLATSGDPWKHAPYGAAARASAATALRVAAAAATRSRGVRIGGR